MSEKALKAHNAVGDRVVELEVTARVVSEMLDALPSKSSKRKGMEVVLKEVARELKKANKDRVSAWSEANRLRARENKERDRRFIPVPSTPSVQSVGNQLKLSPSGFKPVAVSEDERQQYVTAVKGARRAEAIYGATAKIFGCESKEVFLYQWIPDGFRFWFLFNISFHHLLRGTSNAWFDGATGAWTMKDDSDAIALLESHLKRYFACVVEAESVTVLKNKDTPALSRVPVLVDPDDARKTFVGRKRNTIPYTWVTSKPVPFSLERFMVMLRDAVSKESGGSDDALWVNSTRVSIFDGKQFVACPQSKVVLAHVDKLIFELVSDYGAARIVRIDVAANPKSLVAVFEDDFEGMAREVAPYLETYKILDMPTYSEVGGSLRSDP